MMALRRSHARQRHSDDRIAVRCIVIARTGEKVRLRAEGVHDLFDSPMAELDLQLDDVLLVDDGDDWQTLRACVIGLPSPGVVEIETGGVTTEKTLTLRKPQIGAKR